MNKPVLRGLSGLANDFKQTMRKIGSCVSIITCQSRLGETAGMTISSVCSVSVNPDPMISFNVQTPSRTNDILQQCDGNFAINILTPTTEMKNLALAFAGSKGHDYNPFKQKSEHFSYWNGIPFINECNTLVCKVEMKVPVQDHLVIIAKVTRVIEHSKTSMTYLNSKFYGLGHEI